ncbi:MAG TPA: nucleotidyltransferase family protein [Blastocatellia bacterium]|nr:nucleotidyltransferase family protein [Blastocatellia bacterium]
MTFDEVFFGKREEILRIAVRHGARNVRIFGSVARGQAGKESDLDVLVDMEPGRSLLDLGALLMELQELVGSRVDVVTEQGLRPRIRERVLQEAVPL